MQTRQPNPTVSECTAKTLAAISTAWSSCDVARGRAREAGFLAGGLLVIGLAVSAAGVEPQFRPAQLLSAGGVTLDPGSYAIPCAADWNGDGRKDLIVGYRTTDKMAVYLNVGTDANPVFSGYANAQAGGTDIYVAGSGCGAPAPFVCDYDSDGRRDLLVGDGAYGYVYFYRNTNTDSAPLLAAGVRLMVGSSPLSVSYRATPYVCDWDGDGLQDLLCGNGDGYVFFFKNIGTAQTPVYAAGAQLKVGTGYLNLGIRCIVRVADWDGDGLKDLVGSSDSGVYWCRNTNTTASAAPLLQGPSAVRAPVASGSLTAIYTGSRMRLELVDWNNDGQTDLLVGNADGTITYYEGYRFNLATPVMQAGACVLRWTSAPYLRYVVWSGSSLAWVSNRLVTNWPSGGVATSWTNQSPDSAQFYRVQIAQ